MSRFRSARVVAQSTVVALTFGVALSISASWADDPRAITAIPAQAAIDRVLPLEGGVNFRELGGYSTTDGRRVRRGMLYRSGAMAGLTDADYELLSKLDIAVLVDLRDGQGGGLVRTRAEGVVHAIFGEQAHDAAAEGIGGDTAKEGGVDAQTRAGAGSVQGSTADNRGHVARGVDDDVDQCLADDCDHDEETVVESGSTASALGLASRLSQRR